MEARQIGMAEALQTEGDNPEYQAFVDKFKPKLTTDDCYTPPEVYDAIADWVANEYGVDKSRFVRPFWPGGDYEAYPYKPGDIVVDNPPFSILSKIKRHYLKRGVPFFLFGPSLTMLSGGDTNCTYIAADADITYENGAKVRTGFITSLDTCLLRSAPSLFQAVQDAVDAIRLRKTVQLPKYTYPDHVVTAAMVQRYSKYGVEYRLSKEDAVFIRSMDAQRDSGKSVFGGGFLVSDSAAAERAAAESAAAERAAAERAAATRWQLSERELEIVRGLAK